VSTATAPTAFAADKGIPSNQIKKEAARLARAGFVAGAIEHLVSPAGAEGLSMSERFRSSKSARAEVAFAATPPSGVKQTNFTVPGIPRARGFDNSNAQSSGHNIAFAVGSYYYLVGVGWPRGLPNPPPGAQLVTAAQRLYKRVHDWPLGRVLFAQTHDALPLLPLLAQRRRERIGFLIETIKRGIPANEIPVTVQKRLHGHSKKPAVVRYGLGFSNAIVRTWLR
jgi:hypothetical protein